MKRWTVAAALAAVGSVGAAGCGGGISSAKDAPFDLKAKSALWSVADTGDEAYSVAALVLANDKIPCSTLEGKALEDLLQGLIAKGQGALFLIDAVADQGSVVGELTGLWVDDGGRAFEEPFAQYRDLQPTAWDQGFLFDIYDGDTAWLQIDKVENKVSGSFHTAWWWGDFKAEACGTWAGIHTTTTTTTYSTSTTY